LQQTLQYQELKAPVSGTVFNLKANQPGYVANSNQPILEIVPSDALVARVFITNRDIGFVEEGMAVDVRIDSFPYSEFGDVKGTLTHIGSDALPPDQINPQYRFPADVTLDNQTIVIEGKPVQLQSGMSLSANIKTRPKRVIMIFIDLFNRKLDSLKTGN
jgi:HlyD family secretion protein